MPLLPLPSCPIEPPVRCYISKQCLTALHPQCPHHFKSSSCMHKTHAAPVRRKYFLLLQIFLFKFIYSNIFFASSESSIPQKTWTKLCWLSTNPANQSQYVKAIQPGNAKTICKQLHGLCLLVCCICYFICCIFNFICYLGGG